MRGTAQRNRGQSGCHGCCKSGFGPEGQDHGQRTRPEPFGQAARPLVDNGKAFGSGQIGDMNDQGSEAGTPLGPVDARNRLVAVGPCGKAVDRLGRNRDEPPSAQQVRRTVDTFGAGRENGWLAGGGHIPAL
jgi:hypothetical protein